MNGFFLLVVGGLIIWPVHSTAATIGNKPIELFLSDLLPVLMPIIYLLVRSKPTKWQMQFVKVPVRSNRVVPILALMFVVYATSLAGIALGLSGESLRVFSAFKLVKPIGFVFIGLLLGSWTDPLQLVAATGRAAAIVVGLTMFCTVMTPEFPMGEWGRFIFEFELSGYPNSAMSFYACLVPLLLATADTAREKSVRIVCWGVAACAALLILGSMSRSSTLVMLIGVCLYLIFTKRTSILIASFMVLLVISLIGFGMFSALKETDFVAVLSNRIQERIERSTESEDPSSGRFDIWALAIELWIERPVFGYMFESFSRYAGDIDTPHQQYLEVLHKCGGLGLLIYVVLLLSCLRLTRKMVRLSPFRSPAYFQLNAMSALLTALLIGNLTQPNLTFSLTGNMIFLIFGCVCSARTVISASQPSAYTQQQSVSIPSKPPLRRFAA